MMPVLWSARLTAVWCGCVFAALAAVAFAAAVAAAPEDPPSPSSPVRLVTLDPGHFHAALVQKTMLPQIAPVVHVYAPPGNEVEEHLRRIEGFNRRAENPTAWIERVYTGPDYLQKMLAERPGNVVVLSGDNSRKPEYIKACAQAGLHVLADKPMCIDRAGLAVLDEAFTAAAGHGVLIYDIMTERSEVTTVLQMELSRDPEVFGRLEKGTPDDPAVVKESVHHFFKQVAGSPLERPFWFFDTARQGEGIVDVTTHLVDLVMWECFPEEPLEAGRDVVLEAARSWPTRLTRAEFQAVTGLGDFPEPLAARLDPDGRLPCGANGEIVFAVRGVVARVRVAWEYAAPGGGGDTHFSLMRGERASLVIRQGREQGFVPELYVEPRPGSDRPRLAAALAAAVERLAARFPGLGLAEDGDGWRVIVPRALRAGHEAHFAEVMERFLRFLEAGSLPEWELSNLRAKYWLTTAARDRARQAAGSRR